MLRELCLEVPRGQFIALVGRSGGGKTTILNVLTGLVAPTSGEVAVLGVRPTEARSRIGFVPARDALLPWRTALRNVEYSLELRGIARQERKRSARHYLSLVGLEDASHRWPWQLSQGMRQRVALVRAWAVEPQLLLMDEPFAALDADTRQSVRAKFQALLQGGPPRTVVFVTHDLDEAVLMADRVTVLSGGRITADTLVPPRSAQDAAADELTGAHRALLRKLRDALREDERA
ncbi:MAG TPA: ATP-binding cassette domain-containing protein [Candidatus Sulfotelmatobacter sp.]|nr:ATP-binding cassette domain-containing protein [Candidatus Sulfotelmatobacter sp.]